MAERIRVLHVDAPASASAVETHLSGANERFAVQAATDPEAALDAVRQGSVDCVVSGHDLPGTTGVEFLEAVRDEAPDLPFVLFTDGGSEQVASDAIGAGVTDYLPRDGGESFERLARRIEQAVGEYRTEDGRRADREKVEHLHGTSLELSDATSRAEIYELAIAAAEEILSFDTSAICEFRDGVFEPVALRNLDTDFDRLEAGEGLIGEAYESGESGLVDDVRAAAAAEPIDERYRSALTVPIGEYGVFQAVSERVGAFDDADLALTELLLNHVREALESVEYREQLRAANQRLRAILDNTTAVIYAKDTEGRYTLVNERFASIIDMEPSAVVGKTDFDIHSAETAAVVRENDRRAIEEERPIEVEERTLRDGVERTYLSVKVPMFDDDGDPIGVCGISTDITDRKRREQELAYKESLLAAVTETSLDGILVVDDDREFVVYNDRFTELWSIPEAVMERGDDQAAIEAVTDQLADPEAFRESVAHFYENPEATGRTTLELADGRVIDRYTAPVLDDGEYFGRVWYFRDVTERTDRIETLHERTRELERQNERLDAFTSIVSHDLRSPLSVAKGRLELAKADDDPEHVQQALDAVTRMEAIVEETLTLASQGRAVGETEPLDLAALANECWDMVQTGDATLAVADEATFHGDRERVKQVFENLFRNCLDHGRPGRQAGDGGDAAEGDDEDAPDADDTALTVRVGTTPDGIYVADDGRGIPPGDREQVLEAGYTTDEDGTGFGLAIVAEIAGAHGWDVTVTESDDGGARFEFAGVEFAS